MTQRQLALLEYHRDVGDFATTATHPAVFILDLDDREARTIAAITEPDPKKIEDHRATCAATDCFPSLVVATDIGATNAILEGFGISAKPEPPRSMFYIVIVSTGVVVALLPKGL
jgi:hypothetical protein